MGTFSCSLGIGARLVTTCTRRRSLETDLYHQTPLARATV